MEKTIKATVNDLVLERWFRLRHSGKLVWNTKNGETVPVKDMTDEQLLNAIRQNEPWRKWKDSETGNE